MCHPEIPPGSRPPEISSREVVVPLGGGEGMPGLITFPESGSGPGVVIVADIFGRGPFYDHLAERLSQAGFVVIVPDYFHRVGQIERGDYEAAFARRDRLNERAAIAELCSTVDWLRSQAEVVGDAVGTVGFCMGGTLALNMAAAASQLATVSYYGFVTAGPAPDVETTAPAPIDIVSEMSGPILGFWGAEDQRIPVPEVRQFESALESSNIEAEVHVLADAGHGFLAAAEFEPDHPEYQAACDAWTRTVEFYREKLISA